MKHTCSSAVLLLAHGSPASLADLPAFLASVRGGRPMSHAVIKAYETRYHKIGGVSPLATTTARIVDGLSAHLDCPLYLGTRHGAPSIPETVEKMADDGIRDITAICLTPFYSSLSVGAYRVALVDALAALHIPMAINFTEAWHREPAYLEGLVYTLQQGMELFPSTVRRNVTLLFSAHSMPASILQKDDPYPDQIRETCGEVTRRLEIPAERWNLAYQSAPARARRPWLTPDLTDVLRELAMHSTRNVLCVPVGFVVDNLETLYDLDVELKAAAEAWGIQLERAPALNDSPALITALASALRKVRNYP